MKELNIWLGCTFSEKKINKSDFFLQIFNTDYDKFFFFLQDVKVRSLLWLPEITEDLQKCKYGRHFLYNFI